MSTRRGHTLVEVLVAVVVLAIAIGAAALVGLRSEDAIRTESVRLTLDGQARQVTARLLAELRGSSAGSVSGLVESPEWDDLLQFEQVASISPTSGQIDWSTARVELRYEAGEVDDGIDNNGNGLVDEGRVVLIRDPGGPDEIEATLTHWVAEYLEGETPLNALDDNGNGLVDERGLVFERAGNTIRIHLTLQRLDADGRLVTSTAETSVLLRN
jgi:prepilin-type N-terminal cleavage/methylation domain-containing protein